MATKKNAGTKGAAKKAASTGMPKEGKDPKGGLTAAGRKYFNEKTGGNLRPGVKGATDTPEKKKRKRSFLTRHFTTPQGPVVKDGEPTRQALQAVAWGEPVPKTEADEKKLAEKGRELLAEYHEETAGAAKAVGKKAAGKKAAGKKAAGKKAAAKKSAEG